MVIFSAEIIRYTFNRQPTQIQFLTTSCSAKIYQHGATINDQHILISSYTLHMKEKQIMKTFLFH